MDLALILGLCCAVCHGSIRLGGEDIVWFLTTSPMFCQNADQREPEIKELHEQKVISDFYGAVSSYSCTMCEWRGSAWGCGQRVN